MVDLFDEVEEQLRSDRYKALALKALPWVLGALAAGLLLAFGIWFWQEQRQKAAEQASDQYAAALQAATEGRQDEAFKLFAPVTESSAKGYKALALMQQAGIRAGQGRTAEAVKLLDEAAAAAPDEAIGDVARLRAVYLLLDTASVADVRARVAPLMEDERPYRMLAEEALALAKLSNGDQAGARKHFAGLKDLFDAPEGVRQRAAAAVDLIDSGSAKSFSAIVKAAAAPPAPQPAPGAAPAAAPPAAAPSQPAPGSP